MRRLNITGEFCSLQKLCKFYFIVQSSGKPPYEQAERKISKDTKKSIHILSDQTKSEIRNYEGKSTKLLLQKLYSSSQTAWYMHAAWPKDPSRRQDLGEHHRQGENMEDQQAHGVERVENIKDQQGHGGMARG